jgi:hypothetical protein
VSRELLRALDARRVLESMPLPGTRSDLFVPFGRLAGVGVEETVRPSLADLRRIALVGAVGSGKSSLLEYVLLTTADPLAPLWVSAGHEGERTLTDPTEFARHVIRQIVRWAAPLGRMTTTEERAALVSTSAKQPSATTATSQAIGLKIAAGWLEPSWSREVVNTLVDPEVERSRSDFVDSLRDLVELIHAWGLRPILIIDDFDIWVSTAVGGDESKIGMFFEQTCRMLAELNWGVVVSVQPEYCGLPSFVAAREQRYLNERIELPQLDASALRKIFDERVIHAVTSENELATATGKPERLAASSAYDVFEPGFEHVLHGRYRLDWNIRPVLGIAETALRNAIAEGDELVSIAALRAAMFAG